MTDAVTEKARNLLHLSELVPVPPFVVLREGEEPPISLLSSAPNFIIRGCIEGEDLPDQSMAGQGMTIGPVPASAAITAVRHLFEESNAHECIFQQYVDAPSGVLICNSEKQAILEYSRQPGGVTGGKLSPYTALFPNEIPRYSSLSNYLPSLFREFGACDVELVNPENPVFVQVRPFCHSFDFDEELLNAKMNLQELEGKRWIQNEFCMDLLESPGVDLSLIRLYCNELSKLACTIDAGIEKLRPNDFIKIGKQIFMQDKNITPHFSNTIQVINIGNWLYQEYSRLSVVVHQELVTANDLMRAAIIFRTYYDLLEKLPSWLCKRRCAKLLGLRQECRQRLLETVSPEPLLPYVSLTKRLKPLIEKDDYLLNWLSIEYASEEGIVIIPGDFDSGPWQEYEPGITTLERPCFLITDELYPEIFALFPYIKGIICNGGGMNSHLAVLAREKGMPLWIQVQNARRFISDDHQ